MVIEVFRSGEAGGWFTPRRRNCVDQLNVDVFSFVRDIVKCTCFSNGGGAQVAL